MNLYSSFISVHMTGLRIFEELTESDYLVWNHLFICFCVRLWFAMYEAVIGLATIYCFLDAAEELQSSNESCRYC